ncbi:MAG: glutathione synthase [Polyangiales bacterium]
MHFVFVMDPVERVIVDEDTSFDLMLAAEARGHRVDHCLSQDIEWCAGQLRAQVRPATMSRTVAPPVTLGAPTWVDLAAVDVVWIRKDPPFDPPYLWLTLLCEMLRGQTRVLNDPRALREANEKLYACHFPALTPATLVSASRAGITAFVEELGGQAVIKPIDGFAGGGVFVLRRGDANFNVIVETLTEQGQLPVMVQQYLPEVQTGDKRILLVDGEPLGAILRVPQGGDFRSNIHVGGNVQAADLDAADRCIIAGVAERLRADGLFFVGLDVIGGRLTEVNVTSPTGIQQMSRLLSRPLSEDVIRRIEAGGSTARRR